MTPVGPTSALDSGPWWVRGGCDPVHSTQPTEPDSLLGPGLGRKQAGDVPPGAHSLTGDMAGRTREGNIWTQRSSVTTTQPFLTVDIWGKAVQLLRIQGTRVLAPSPRLTPHPPRTALNLGERSPILGTEVSRTPIWPLSSHTTPHRARRPWGRGDVNPPETTAALMEQRWVPRGLELPPQTAGHTQAGGMAKWQLSG